MNHSIDRVGFVANPDCGRGTLNILWLCLSTIFLCTFTALHLDVPPWRPTRTEKLKRLALRTAMGVLLPEIPPYYALKEHLASRVLRRMWNDKALELKSGIRDLSINQARYILTGALVITDKDHEATIPLVRISADLWLNEASMTELRERIPSNDEIEDVNKVDSIGRFITCTQAAWTGVTIAGRLRTSLEVSLLEVVTASYIVLAITAYAFYWTKPKDLAGYTAVELPALHRSCLDDPRTSAYLAGRSVGRQSAYFLQWDHAGALLISGHLWDDVRPLLMLGLAVAFLALAGMHVAAWNYDFPTSMERNLWRAAAVTLGAAPLSIVCFVVPVDARWTDDRVWIKWMGGVIMVVAEVLYLVARLYIIIETFAAFRSAPVGIYKQLNWSSYVGHIGA